MRMCGAVGALALLARPYAVQPARHAVDLDVGFGEPGNWQLSVVGGGLQ